MNMQDHPLRAPRRRLEKPARDGAIGFARREVDIFALREDGGRWEGRFAFDAHFPIFGGANLEKEFVNQCITYR